ncbi:MAG: EAL domain-containing protein, partial [Rhodocyclaceae bacterium]|nr:EAL domain-containing protein [Rhodocyclaceae bacterium]
MIRPPARSPATMDRTSRQLASLWIIAAIVAGWIAIDLARERTNTEREATERLVSLARLVSEQARGVMDATLLGLHHTALELTTAGFSADVRSGQLAYSGILAQSVSQTPAVDDLLLAGTTGQLLASSTGAPARGTMAGEPYFETLRDNPLQALLTTTVRGRQSGRWGLLLAQPILGPEGQFAGVLAAHVGLERTFLSFYRDLGLSPGTSVAVWNREATLLLRQPFSESLIGTRVTLPQVADLLAGKVSESTFTAASPIDGAERLIAVRSVEGHPLIVSVSQRRDEALAAWNTMAWRSAALLAVLAAACALVHRLARRARGSEQRLDHLIAGAPVGVVCFDTNRRGAPVPFACNLAARRLLPVDPVTGLPDAALVGIRDEVRRVASQGGTWHASDYRLDGADGPCRVDLRLFAVGPGQAGLLVEDATQRLTARDEKLAELERHRSALDEADNGIREWNVAERSMSYSRRWLSQLGYQEGDIDARQESWEGLIHDADLGRCLQDLERHQAGLTAAFRSEHRMRRSDGSYIWVRERGRVVARNDRGAATRMVFAQTDISAIRQIEDNLALWARVFSSAQEGIIVTDAEARIIEANDAYCTSTGYDRGDLIGQNPRILSSGLQEPAFYRAMWTALREEGIWQGELSNRRKDGSFFVQSTRIVSMPDRDGKVGYYIGFTNDISDLRDSQQLIAHLSRHDALTALPNRNQLGELMHQAIAMAQRNNRLLAVCMLDVDHFKPINERWGAEEGDKLLVEVSRRLQEALAPGDTLARMGGDEFVLLLTGIESAEHCDRRVAEFLARMRLPFERPAGVVRLTASVGATLYPFDGGDPDTLLRHADQALYLAKQGGRDACHLFDTEQDRRLSIHRRAVCEVRAALEKGQLRLHYQPKVRFDDGKVIGVEALLRWQHAQRGLLMPAEFISRINDEELLVLIGEWCLETAVEQAARWHAAGDSIPVSVNVTAGQILGPEFAARIEALLERHPDFPPHLLEVEVLESAALADLPRVVTLMERCARRGVSFALDDFGTGYASLTYLKHLPAATLKIDQSFVRDILDDPEHRAIVEGVLGLTRVFGRTAIAEGVESIEHGEALIMLGATHGQGYAIAGALQPDELQEWIGQWRNPPEWTRASWRYRNQSPAARANARSPATPSRALAPSLLPGQHHLDAANGVCREMSA